jgi:hypothetical protein
MKKSFAIYLVLSAILFVMGLSPFARKYIREDFGRRSDTFDPDNTFWIDGSFVYSSGALNSRNTSHLPKTSKPTYARINLSDTTAAAAFVEEIPQTAIRIPTVEVEYGSDTADIARSHEKGIFGVFASRSATRFIVDSTHESDPVIRNLYYASPYYRTPLASSLLPVALPLAYVADFATAPFQCVYIVFVSFVTPKWN